MSEKALIFEKPGIIVSSRYVRLHRLSRPFQRRAPQDSPLRERWRRTRCRTDSSKLPAYVSDFDCRCEVIPLCLVKSRYWIGRSLQAAVCIKC